MENFSTEKRGHKWVIIVAVIAGVVIVAFLSVLIFLKIRAGKTKTPIAPVSTGVGVKEGQVGSSSGGNTIVESPVVPAIPPGIDRPLTQDEKKKYGFNTADDIWLKTSNPTDGSQPFMSFYNKTINPNPYPTVPVFVHHE